MHVHMRYFASVREVIGREQDQLELPADATAAQARAAVEHCYPPAAHVLASCALAVNRAYVAADAALSDGDELVFIPPLGGG